MGPDYIITVRRGPSTSYAPVRTRCETDPELLRLGVDYVLYELLAFVIDNYLEVIRRLQEAADAIDGRIEEGRFERMDIRRLYALRRELVKMRRITAPDGRDLRPPAGARGSGTRRGGASVPL